MSELPQAVAHVYVMGCDLALLHTDQQADSFVPYKVY